MRHAKAEHEDGVRDVERALTKRGRRSATRVGELLTDRLPERVIASSSVRTRETVEYFSKAAGYTGPVHYLDALYLGAPSAYLTAVNELGRAEPEIVAGPPPRRADAGPRGYWTAPLPVVGP